MTPETGLLDLPQLTTLFRREWRLLVTIPAVVAGAAFLVLLPQRDRFSATVAIVPETRAGNTAGQLAGLAAFAGISLGGGGGSQTPPFYAALLTDTPR